MKLQIAFKKYPINAEGGIRNQDILINVSFAEDASKFSLVSNPSECGLRAE